MLLRMEEGRGPKGPQILREIRRQIESGTLRPGERLPSTRRLGEQLGLHRTTVAAAYQELGAQGWIEMRPGAPARVRARLALITEPPSAAPGGFDWARAAGPGIAGPPERARAEAGVIDFARMDMDLRLLPAEALRASLNRVLRRSPECLGYGATEGYGPLRATLARRLARHGIAAAPEEILVTRGCQQGLDLVFRMLAAPGRVVALESPTYDFAAPLLRLAGLQPVEIPLSPSGMDLNALETRMQVAPPALVYTMPSFQNPTGISTDQAHRERLLALCERYGVPLLEDGFEEEMKYFGKAVLPIKSMDRQGLVIYAGTFSKVLFPGLRIGWIAAPRECIRRLAALRRLSEIAPDTLLQAAVHDFCERGQYDLHLTRMHRRFRKRMETALRALRQQLDPAWAQWEEPNGGYLLWLRLLPPPGDPPDWERLLAAHGLRAAPGAPFFPSPNPGTFLRLSISTLDETQIEEGITRLGRALAHIHRPH